MISRIVFSAIIAISSVALAGVVNQQEGHAGAGTSHDPVIGFPARYFPQNPILGAVMGTPTLLYEYNVPKPVPAKSMEKVAKIVKDYEVNPLFASRLGNIIDHEIVLLLDDSGSMNKETDVPGIRDRWHELQQYTKIAIEVGNAFDEDGIDIYFLGREEGEFRSKFYQKTTTIPRLKNVQTWESVEGAFEALPEHGTPLITRVKELVETYKISDKPVLFLVATDGEPQDGTLSKLRRILHIGHNKFVDVGKMQVPSYCFRLCTGEDKIVENFDKKIDRCPLINSDVCDDFNNEAKQISSIQGEQFPFTYGDYVIKSILGAVDPWFDYLDERRLPAHLIAFTAPLPNVEEKWNALEMKTNDLERTELLREMLITEAKTKNIIGGKYFAIPEGKVNVGKKVKTSSPLFGCFGC